MTKASDMATVYVRFIHETLGSLAAPDVREQIVQSALRISAPSELPRDPDGFAKFVRGPLRAAMLNTLGADVTDSISAELEHVLRISSPPASTPGPIGHEFVPPKERALIGTLSLGKALPHAIAGSGKLESGSRLTPYQGSEDFPESSSYKLESQRPASQPYERGTASVFGMRGSQGSSARVFVASQSQSFVHGLAHFLEPETIRIDDVMELLHALNDARGYRAVIVLDCKRPSIRPVALAALAEELPATVQVVLWGAGSALRYQLAHLSPSASTWLNCSEDDDLQSVALRCEALVG
jgi:hypothetical protein